MPAHPYASYAQFTQVYSVAGLTQPQLENHYLPAGARWIDGRLGSVFTVPFSSTNLTARDLNIHASMYLFLSGRTAKQDDAEEILKMLDGCITSLVSSNGVMLQSDDTTLAATSPQFQAWSTQKDYSPTFNMLDVVEQRVDHDRIIDERDRDI